MGIAEADPAKLAQFGPPEAVLAELRSESTKARASKEVMARAEAVAALSPDQKRASDLHRWRVWLRAYAARLQEDGGPEDDALPRRARMRAVNPRVVLRNWVAQESNH